MVSLTPLSSLSPYPLILTTTPVCDYVQLLLHPTLEKLYNTVVNPFTPKSDWHLISPYNITPESHSMVMRIKEMISNN